MKTSEPSIKYWLALTPPLIAFALYLLQDGFKGGHGVCDLAIFVLGLPWSGAAMLVGAQIPDIVWLIILPAILNVAAAALISRFWPRREHLI